MKKSYLYNIGENKEDGIIVGMVIIEIISAKHRLVILENRIYDQNGKHVAWFDDKTMSVIDLNGKVIASTYSCELSDKLIKSFNDKIYKNSNLNNDEIVPDTFKISEILESFKDYIFSDRQIMKGQSNSYIVNTKSELKLSDLVKE